MLLSSFRHDQGSTVNVRHICVWLTFTLNIIYHIFFGLGFWKWHQLYLRNWDFWCPSPNLPVRRDARRHHPKLLHLLPPRRHRQSQQPGGLICRMHSFQIRGLSLPMPGGPRSLDLILFLCAFFVAIMCWIYTYFHKHGIWEKSSYRYGFVCMHHIFPAIFWGRRPGDSWMITELDVQGFGELPPRFSGQVLK